jgi:protein-disulfide isomerase
MSRTSLALAVVAGALAGMLATTVYYRNQPAIDAQAVRSIVNEALAEARPANIDQAMLNPMIETFLMSDPRLLERMSQALDSTLRTEERAKAQVALASSQTEIYEDPDNIVLGNPEGDVTLVELFDYNCGFCRSALPDMAELLDSDPNLRIILKEYPILSRGSVEAARVALLVAKADVDYWGFHEALFTSRGQVDGSTALAAAQTLGLSPVSLELDMQSPPVTQALSRTVQLARQLNITGTPTYIIGDEIIPGAVGVDTLKAKIANMRNCGSTVCS